MGFTVEQDCPQCGAPVELDETDRLLTCPYCGVKSFLFASSYYRFVLPHQAPDRQIFYVPYLRFKGNTFFCSDQSVGYRIIDITHAGLGLEGIPLSLGVRPQALKLKFVTPQTGGEFLKFTRKASDILSKAEKLPGGAGSQECYHRAYIGETLSLIYFPLYVDGDRLVDAILNRPMATLSRARETIDQAVKKAPGWKLTFMATLCPKCGWNLDGNRDSIVLTCQNCDTAWEASEGKFVPVTYEEVPGEGSDTVYLPFWRISARAQGMPIDSFADFIRVTNQPRVIGKDWENQEMQYWSPAFKIRPKIFLDLSRQMTLSQQRFESERRIPKKNLFPVTLPRTEAMQSIKLTLAGSAMNKKDVFPMLPGLKFKIKGATLVYLPFTETSHEMIQQHMGTSINKNTLEFGRNL